MAEEPQAPKFVFRQLKEGDKIGQYELLAKLGEGPFGTVYRAHDAAMNRVVAVKLLRVGQGTEFADQILAIMQALARLNHPNLAQVFFVGQQQGLIFYVEEFVNGPSVDQLILRRGRLTEREALDFARQAAEGLKLAQEYRIIHGNLKPSNLLVTPSGQVKVTDFGLVKPEGETSGMLNYTSPEQFRGEELDHRSDIYSLGAVLYHGLAGKPPFQGPTAEEMMQQHLTAPVPPLEGIAPGMSERLTPALFIALAKDRNLRYQTYDDFITALNNLLGGAPAAPGAEPAPAAPVITLTPETILRPTWRPLKIAITVTMLIVVAWLAVPFYHAVRGRFGGPKAAKPTATVKPPPPMPPAVPPKPVAPPSPPKPPPPEESIEAQALKKFDALKAEADELVKRKRFGEALVVYLDWPENFAGTTGDVSLRAERNRVEAAARNAWTKTQEEANTLRRDRQYSAAIARFREVERDFGVPEYADQARQQIAALEQEQRDYNAQVGAARATLQRLLREVEPKYQQQLATACTLIASVQYERAQQGVREAAATDNELLAEKLALLRADVDLLAALKQNLIRKVAAKPLPNMSLKTRTGGVEGVIAAVDKDNVATRQFLGGGATVDRPVAWSTLQPASVAALLRAAVEPQNAEHTLAHAVLLYYQALLRPPTDAAGRQAAIADARKAFESIGAQDTTRKAVAAPYLEKLALIERRAQFTTEQLQKELAAAALWQQVQDYGAKKQTEVAGALLQSLQEQYGGTEFVRTDKKAEIAKLTAPSGGDQPGAGGVINLLALVDVNRDRVNGNWRMEGGKLISGREQFARLQLPYDAPSNNYDFIVSFMRPSGGTDVNLICRRAQYQFMWSMAGGQNTVHGFDTVGGKWNSDNHTTVKGSLESGRTYTARVEVRPGRVTAFIDDKQISEWKLKDPKLDIRGEWKLPQGGSGGRLGVGSHDGETVFTKIELRIVE